MMSYVSRVPGETGIHLEWKQRTPLCSRVATGISWSSLGGLKGQSQSRGQRTRRADDVVLVSSSKAVRLETQEELVFKLESESRKSSLLLLGDEPFCSNRP